MRATLCEVWSFATRRGSLLHRANVHRNILSCAKAQPDSAGWSSLVARRAHNPEVVGSNPAPATKNFKVIGQVRWPFFVLWRRSFCSVAVLWQLTMANKGKSGSGKHGGHCAWQRRKLAPGVGRAAVVSRQEVAVRLVRDLDAFMPEPHGDVLYRHALL